jgi:hypothetical protein
LEIEAAIQRYVAQHPEAKDTVEGIVQWWLGPQVRASVAEVKAALGRMVTQGQMVSEQQVDGRIYYHRAEAAGNYLGTKRDNFNKRNSGRPGGRNSNPPKQT